MKTGVMLDSFCLPFAEAAHTAAALGADGVQIYAVNEDFCPTIPAKRKAECRRVLADEGLVVSALCGDLGGHGFSRAAENRSRIDRTKAIMEMACEFDTHVVTTHIGCIPEDESSPVYEAQYRAMEELASFGDACGVHLAIETGPEKVVTLSRFVRHFSPAIGINYDPANLVMVTGDDPVAGVAVASDRIFHTHVKDGVQHRPSDPERVYAILAEGGIACEGLAEYFTETPLGEGAVPMDDYFAALRQIGYDGFLTVEREVGADPRADIARAVAYIKEQLKRA